MSGRGFGSSAPSESGRNAFGMESNPSSAPSAFGSPSFGRIPANGQAGFTFGRNPSNGQAASDNAVARNDEPLISFETVHKAMYDGGMRVRRTTLMAKFNIPGGKQSSPRQILFWRVVDELCHRSYCLILKEQYHTATLSPEVLQQLEASLLDDDKKRKAEDNHSDPEMSPAKRQRKDSGDDGLTTTSQSQFLRKTKKSVASSPNVPAQKTDTEPYKRNRLPPNQEDVIDLCNSSDEESSDEEDEDLQAALAGSYWTAGQDKKKASTLTTPDLSMDSDPAYNSWKEKRPESSAKASKKPASVHIQASAANSFKAKDFTKNSNTTINVAQQEDKKKESREAAPVARAIPKESCAFVPKKKSVLPLGKSVPSKKSPFSASPALFEKKKSASNLNSKKDEETPANVDETRFVLVNTPKTNDRSSTSITGANSLSRGSGQKNTVLAAQLMKVAKNHQQRTMAAAQSTKLAKNQQRKEAGVVKTTIGDTEKYPISANRKANGKHAAAAQKTEQEDEDAIPDMDEDAEIEVSINTRKPSLWKRLLVWLLMMLVLAPIVLVAFQYYEVWNKEKLAAEAKSYEWDFYKLKW